MSLCVVLYLCVCVCLLFVCGQRAFFNYSDNAAQYCE